ncbi:MAG: lipid-A-disaccharide synthase, partial [Ignavibacteriaceae bacterium]
NLKFLRDNTYNLLKYSKFGIIKSGTSTLEAGLFELPMVIVYKTSPLTYLIGKRLVKVNSIGMANIISGENVVPELIQNDATSEKIYSEAKNILSNDRVYESIKQKLGRIKEKLGTEGASERAARSIYEVMNEV